MALLKKMTDTLLNNKIKTSLTHTKFGIWGKLNKVVVQKIKQKSRLPFLIRKHVLTKKSNLDIFYLNGVCNMR